MQRNSYVLSNAAVDAVWAAVEAAIEAGMSPRDFRNVAAEAWEHELRDHAKGARQELTQSSTATASPELRAKAQVALGSVYTDKEIAGDQIARMSDVNRSELEEAARKAVGAPFEAQAVRLVCGTCKRAPEAHDNAAKAGETCMQRNYRSLSPKVYSMCDGVLVVASAGEETNDGK